MNSPRAAVEHETARRTSASFNRSATIAMIISSDKSSPRSMMTLALRPRSDPLLTADRSMSPVAMWGTT